MPGGEERILRRRIRSVEATKKITRAFELIAASQIVRATGRIAGSKPYVEGIRHILNAAASETHGASRLIGEPEKTDNVLLVLIVADRGLCGGYNTIALRTAERFIRAGRDAGQNIRLITVGKKAQSFFRFRGIAVDQSFTQMTDRPTYADARSVAAEMTSTFLSGEVDAVELVSWRYVSSGTQTITTQRVLPLPAIEPDGESLTVATPEGEEKPAGYYDFEPDPEKLLELLVPQYAEAILYEALLQASASEHTARQRAMAAATENAEEFITSLRRQMNRIRQEAITTEIMEIVGGAEALRSAGSAGYVDIDVEHPEEQIA